MVKYFSHFSFCSKPLILLNKSITLHSKSLQPCHIHLCPDLRTIRRICTIRTIHMICRIRMICMIRRICTIRTIHMICRICMIRRIHRIHHFDCWSAEILRKWKYFGFSQLILGYKQTFTVYKLLSNDKFYQARWSLFYEQSKDIVKFACTPWIAGENPHLSSSG